MHVRRSVAVALGFCAALVWGAGCAGHHHHHDDHEKTTRKVTIEGPEKKTEVKIQTEKKD